jgi:hypothetical protein
MEHSPSIPADLLGVIARDLGAPAEGKLGLAHRGQQPQLMPSSLPAAVATAGAIAAEPILRDPNV